MPASGAYPRIEAMSPRKASVSPKRRIRRSTGPEECWNDRSKYGATPGVVAITSTSVGRVSAGCR